MTQEDKELLLKDLCARLPYGVICNDSQHGNSKITEIDTVIENVYCNDFDEYVDIENCKPYLRPMSSMTEEEKKEIKPLFSKFTDEFGKRVLVVRQNKMALYQDWLNRNHFDYRGLIPKGLALKAPEGMYNN